LKVKLLSLVKLYLYGEPIMTVVLKVRKKGVIILPKKLRLASGIEEESEVIAEASPGIIILKPLKPKEVEIDPAVVDKLLEEERHVEEKKFHEILRP
jgi:bifunctional DNA-binding transcriptional regulator/antitoxin component of YhaV-PrlF toxin-antitoxin module